MVLDNVLSPAFSIYTGFSQGSVLSAALFLITINNLLSITEVKIHSYAFDSTLHSPYLFSIVTLMEFVFCKKRYIKVLLSRKPGIITYCPNLEGGINW